jgi:hypothetical protein
MDGWMGGWMAKSSLKWPKTRRCKPSIHPSIEGETIMGWAEIKFVLESYGYEEIQHDLEEDSDDPSEPKSDHPIYYDESFSTMRPTTVEEFFRRRDGP